MHTDDSSPGCRDCTAASRREAVERVIVTMNEQLDEPLSLNDMAKIAYMSPYHFNRVFHQITGLPPTKFLYAMRLGAAKRLLLTTSHSVADVCYEVGYNSLGTFTTRFTQLVGLSPGHLRRLAERINNTSLESLQAGYSDTLRASTPRHSVSGRIESSGPFDGLIFVGLFTECIPQSRPVGGTLLTSLGNYHIDYVPDGRYYLFAAAFPSFKEPLSYLLPGGSAVLVGAGLSPLVMRNGKARGTTDITLRPMRLIDPPLLVSLPFLLTAAPGVEQPA